MIGILYAIMFPACRSVRYEHGSCRSTAGAPLLIIAAAIGVVVLVAVIVVAFMLRFSITILQLIRGSDRKHNFTQMMYGSQAGFVLQRLCLQEKEIPGRTCAYWGLRHFISTIVMAHDGQSGGQSLSVWPHSSCNTCLHVVRNGSFIQMPPFCTCKCWFWCPTF